MAFCICLAILLWSRELFLDFGEVIAALQSPTMSHVDVDWKTMMTTLLLYQQYRLYMPKKVGYCEVAVVIIMLRDVDRLCGVVPTYLAIMGRQ